jgi:hypothetical protein
VVAKNLGVAAFAGGLAVVRKVRTAFGAVAVQIVTRRVRQVDQFEHVGPAHADAELALPLASAGERLRPGQDALDLDDLAVVRARMGDVADWTTGPSARPQVARAGGRAPPRSLTCRRGQG